MTRYFYTNVMEAALMHLQHGIQFELALYYGYSNGQFVISTRHPQGAIHNNTRFYIHPDSVALLEPQVGDTIRCRDGMFMDNCLFNLVADDTDYQHPFNVVPFHVEQFLQNVRVIQRNGIPFMWPEVEA